MILVFNASPVIVLAKAGLFRRRRWPMSGQEQKSDQMDIVFARSSLAVGWKRDGHKLAAIGLPG